MQSYLKSWYEVGLGDFLAHGVLKVGELVCDHETDPPRLVLRAASQRRHYQLFDVLILSTNTNQKLEL